MTVKSVKTLGKKSVTSRGVIAAALAVSTLTLGACSAGQITQTSDQVAAVDGARADSADNLLAVRDVTVLVDRETAQAALKFTAINMDPSMQPHSLEKVTVGGEEVNLSESPIQLDRNCSVVASSAADLENTLKANSEGTCIAYVTTSLDNPGFATGGNEKVVFSFDTGDLEVTATVSGEPVKAGHEVPGNSGKPSEAAGHSNH